MFSLFEHGLTWRELIQSGFVPVFAFLFIYIFFPYPDEDDDDDWGAGC